MYWQTTLETQLEIKQRRWKGEVEVNNDLIQIEIGRAENAEEIAILIEEQLHNILLFNTASETSLKHSKDKWEIEKLLAKMKDKSLTDEQRLEAIYAAQTKRKEQQLALEEKLNKEFSGQYEIVGNEIFYTGSGFDGPTDESSFENFQSPMGGTVRSRY